jgi:hypothetical protein
MPPHMLHRPVTRSDSLRRKQDTDQLLALDSLVLTLTQSDELATVLTPAQLQKFKDLSKHKKKPEHGAS